MFGAAGLGSMSQEDADALLATILEFGVNHLDTAASYGDSELRLAPWLARHRGEFFLATKTDGRTSDSARAELERSLERLGVDHVDLIQLHNLVEEDEWSLAHSAGGAVAGLLRARDEGLARHVGVTGHGLRIAGMHLRTLARADLDAVLLPYNFALLGNDDYRRDVERLLALCAERRIAVQTIKSIAERRWGPQDTGARFSWYKPTEDEGALARAVRYVLSNEQLFLNTSSDTRLLRPILEAAASRRELGAPSEVEMVGDVDRLGIELLFDGAAHERI
ncbi:MAG: aldo/keto reductase [Acidimicrobiales bacterium]